MAESPTVPRTISQSSCCSEISLGEQTSVPLLAAKSEMKCLLLKISEVPKRDCISEVKALQLFLPCDIMGQRTLWDSTLDVCGLLHHSLNHMYRYCGFSRT